MKYNVVLRAAVILAGLWLFQSCATKKEIIYFQDAANLDQTMTSQEFNPIIENNDILYITVSSIDKVVAAPFQRNTGMENQAAGGNNIGLQGYLVDTDGEIQFPVLGSIPVAGKTRGDVAAQLTELLKEYITDVVVDVRIVNFKVTVIGEVQTPGVFKIEDERVTLPQAIGLAGDFTEDGNRENVTVIREVNGKQRVTTVDFTKTDFFTSEFFFLKQNDIVYVEPSLKGVRKSGFIPDVPALLSLVTVVLSTVILLTR
ncbi:polysaccharide biosynthesis/export family protein [Altibacter sp. HG106]|uniref:polysaccharide biosynthesis/export family protein n=1 Tax=Altibacter sp. HG106 TaxID=3023937 RepID=UPI002350BF24|nr:polysaccharide biosynthesis/export family protein [Altibacter sp. HG106]MDC7995352.1 polysaccharide biosynthesis/export family protein [Altibacter sp. HG106]